MMLNPSSWKISIAPGLAVWISILTVSTLPIGSLAQHEDEHDHAAEAEGHQAVVLSPAEQTEFNIETAPAGPGVISISIQLPAEIHANDDHLAHIVPRYEGIVTEVLVRVGDQVEVGQTLALIEGDASLAVYPLKTRIAGTVISKHITMGEAADRSRAPFVIADLSTVWLDIHVFQRELARVHEGQRVMVTSGLENNPAFAEISYVAPVVDEVTRTSVARAVLDNKDGRWRPGMFVTASVEVGAREAGVAVPATALFTVHDHPVVFIADEHGFEIREVKIGVGNGTLVEILEGLRPGETIVTRGGFTLKAELEKSTFGDGHNH